MPVVAAVAATALAAALAVYDLVEDVFLTYTFL